MEGINSLPTDIQLAEDRAGTHSELLYIILFLRLEVEINCTFKWHVGRSERN